ncbi:DcaP family trimeric outer membrane transporter [Colwelliaceae bacterium BS250]
MLKRNKIALATGLALLAGSAQAGYTFKINETDSITFGGYIKVDARYTDGDVPYRDFWIGSGGGSEDKSQIKLFANESRINTKFVHGDVTGFIEMDFYGGGGNEVISNSSNPRMRHAFIKYEKFTFGQTWTTFMNTSSLAETADFGGPQVAEAFVRNTLIRYTNGGLELAIENPETWGSEDNPELTPDPANDDFPDLIAKYSFKGDWGNVSVAGLARVLNVIDATGDEDTESAVGISVAGKINVFAKDDIRFSVSTGNLGRYVGITAATDLYNGEVEESTSVMAAYRHFWTETVRTSVFFGNTTTEESDRDRSHYGVNIFKNYTKELSYGFEVGNYVVDDQDSESLYAQFSAKYVL